MFRVTSSLVVPGPSHAFFLPCCRCFLPEHVQREHIESMKEKNLNEFNAKSKMAQMKLQQLMLK